MTTTARLKELREMVYTGYIFPGEALEEITSSTTKPWQLTSWKTRRAKIIKHYCEQCGSEQGPLVIQHLWHPKPFWLHKREAEKLLKSGKRKTSKLKLEVMKKAVLTAIDESLRYRELREEDIRTFCKKCSFLMDRKYLVLCQNCLTNYHLIGYQTCRNCARAAEVSDLQMGVAT